MKIKDYCKSFSFTLETPLNFVLFLTGLLFFLGLIYFFIDCIQNYNPDISVNGFNELITIIENYKTSNMPFIILLPIIIAIKTYKLNSNITKIQSKTEQATFMLSLRKMFQTHDEVHNNLRGGHGTWVNKKIPNNNYLWSKIDSYLGLFELCYFMLQKELINKKEFENLYLYRIQNIINNKSIVNKINSEREYWLNFIALLKMYEVKSSLRSTSTDSNASF